MVELIKTTKLPHSEGLFTHFDIVKYTPYWDTINYYTKEKRNIKIMDTQNNFSVHYQTWKNKDAVKKVLTEFRNHFPNNPIRLVSDNGAEIIMILLIHLK